MTDAPKSPPRPADLRSAGRRLWADVVDSFELGADELANLRAACRLEDELVDLRKAMKGQPMTVEGSTGQLVAHPLLAEIRRHSELLTKHLALLSLPAGDEDAGSTPAQKRAQRAAQQRWRDRQASVKGANRGAA